jgi:DNA-binding XRE family transcriptional regulator
MRVTGDQIRAARAYLNWTIADLAKAASVGDSTLRAIEAGKEVDGGLDATRSYRTKAREETLARIVKTLEDAGVTFLRDDGRGAGLRAKT